MSKDLLDVFNFALVWGRSTKFNPQRVGLSHVLMDEDVFQVVPKTLVQQKQSKDYRQKVMTALDSFQCMIDVISDVLVSTRLLFNSHCIAFPQVDSYNLAIAKERRRLRKIKT